MANTRDDIKRVKYLDDNDQPHRAKLTESIRVAGGFAILQDSELTLPKWKGGRRTMRKMHIVQPNGLHRDSVPVAERGNTKYNLGGTVDGVAGRDGWIVTGKTGEHFTFA